jgi:collagen type VI alpha
MFSIILINCFTILSSFWVLSQGFERKLFSVYLIEYFANIRKWFKNLVHKCLVNECYSKPETGLCKALFLRYYYDKQTNKCQKFNYGGCGGNGNRFFTEDECIRTCSLKQVQRNNSLNLKNGIQSFVIRDQYSKKLLTKQYCI